METMLFSDEVIPPDSIEELGSLNGDLKTSERELDMAQQLIDSLTSEFEPEKYRDEYRERVLELIERKAQGETVVIEAPPEEPKEVPDLMAALEASIASAKSPKGDGAGGKKKATRSRSASSSQKKTTAKS
jgi:DNA end-binding protein Ku